MKKMRNLLLLIMIAASIACQRKESVEGPLLDDLYGDFTVLEDFSVSTTQADFSDGANVIFMARFNKNVDWEIQIIGQNSGAEKILSGKSKLVDESNAAWNGSTTILPMFRSEDCVAIISVPDELYADTLTLSIDQTKVNEGFLLSDFENGLNPGWDAFVQTGADMSFYIVESDSAAQENHYYDMGGAVDWDYLIGYIDMPASAYQEATYPLSENPANVYFNALLYKPLDISNEIILWQFMEDENLDGVFDANTEDMYSVELTGIEDGWQTLSIRYSEMTALANGAPVDPAGNGIHEPHKLLNIRLLFLANPATGYSQAFIDYLIFTENQALEP